jgi:formate hydrogenlyase subunit 3/multisubunit Na+/H+ antiporter MnhD subunit
MLSIFLILIISFSINIIFVKKIRTNIFLSVVNISLFSLVGFISSIKYLLEHKALEINNNLGILPLSFKINELSLFFLIIIFLISFISVIYSYGYLINDKNIIKLKIHYLNIFLLILSMSAVVISNNSISFIVAWEIMSISSYFLVIYNNENIDVRVAGLKYFIFTHIGGLFILSSFAIAYAQTGYFSFSSFKNIPESYKLIVFLLSFIGFASKAGVFPLHVWLPYAHPAAPSHISAIMSGVMIKIGIFAIIKMFLLLNFAHNTIYLAYLILILAILSAVLGVVYALGQDDIKKLLAYSSVENIGIILIGFAITLFGIHFKNNFVQVFAFAGMILHILNHSIFKTLLFLGAGSVIHSTHIKSINKLGGLIKNLKTTSYTFLIASIAISGIPPLNGFISELLIYIASFNMFDTSKYIFMTISITIISLAVVGGIALAVFTKLYGIVFLGKNRSPNIKTIIENSFSMKISMLLLSLFCLIIGIFPYPFVKSIIKISKNSLLITDINLKINFLNNMTYFYLLFLFIIFCLLFIKRNKLNKTSKYSTWSCGYQFATPKIQYTGTSFASPIMNFYSQVAPVKKDDKIIKDIFPEKIYFYSQIIDLSEFFINNFFVKPFCKISNIFRYIQHGNIQIYISYILIILVILLLMI